MQQNGALAVTGCLMQEQYAQQPSEYMGGCVSVGEVREGGGMVECLIRRGQKGERGRVKVGANAYAYPVCALDCAPMMST